MVVVMEETEGGVLGWDGGGLEGSEFSNSSKTQPEREGDREGGEESRGGGEEEVEVGVGEREGEAERNDVPGGERADEGVIHERGEVGGEDEEG